tara:strand:+ start:202 stop:345 length:144 start_codon:yes stop_codon:yes gene_type:complete
MAKAMGAYSQKHVGVKKGTSQGRRPDTSTMNKHKKRSFKKYRGQGKR